ncbi:hypothetical protein ACQKI9_31685, partial [Achromobacter xylosoxidans]
VTGKPAAKLFAQSTTDLTVLADQITTEDYGIILRFRAGVLVAPPHVATWSRLAHSSSRKSNGSTGCLLQLRRAQYEQATSTP